jgi:hypothetical protein
MINVIICICFAICITIDLIKASQLTKKSKLAFIGDFLVEEGQRNINGFVRLIGHELNELYPGIAVHAFTQGIDYMDGAIEVFEKNMLQQVLDEYEPTHVVIMFGVSDVLRYIDEHYSGEHEREKIKYNADGDIERHITLFTMKYMGMLERIAERITLAGAAVYLCSPGM